MLMHGFDYTDQNLAGHILSEKLDGCRAYWTGTELVTKSGRPYRAVPAEMLAELRTWGAALDCELCVPDAPRAESLRLASAAALRASWAPALRLMAFDAPDMRAPALARREALRVLGGRLVLALPFWRATSTADALAQRASWISRGREGLMAQDPASEYRPGRREALLKLK